MNILKSKRKQTTTQTLPEQQEPSHTPTFTEGQINSDSLKRPPITNEEIQGTPFRIVNIPETGWFLTLGLQRIGDICKTKNDAIKPVLNKDWQLICNVIVTIIEQVNNIMKEQQNNKL